MATSTFDKHIVIGPEAAQRLVDALNDPNKRDLSDLPEAYEQQKRGEEAIKRWSLRLSER